MGIEFIVGIYTLRAVTLVDNPFVGEAFNSSVSTLRGRDSGVVIVLITEAIALNA
jgi:hypothetical protein